MSDIITITEPDYTITITDDSIDLVSIGTQGAPGTPGSTGPAGPQGTQGVQGVQGVVGDTGPTGPTGVVDWQGAWVSGNYTVGQSVEYNGSSYICILDTIANEVPTNATYWDLLVAQGDQGIQGIQGIQGVVGDTGPQGTQGVQGITGDTGPTGPTGPQGLKGDDGAQGVQGVQGDEGIQGIQGTTGPQGLQGDQGIQGITGDTGLTGDTGPQGDQGIQGIQGIQGSPGIDGDDGVAGVGVPIGGTAGQHLSKIDGTDYNTQWETPPVVITDHTGLTSIGTNTHAQIDAHIDLGSPIHFTQAQISITESQISDLGTYEPAFGKNTGFNLVLGTGSGQVAEGDHLHGGVYEPAFTKNTAFNVDFGTGSPQVARGNHLHTGVYEPADATILKDSDINVNVQAYSATNALTGDITYETLDTNGDVGTAAGTLAIGDHLHGGVYEPANANIQSHIGSPGIHFTQAQISITESQISDLQTYLLDITGENLVDLADVVGGSPLTSGQVLTWNGANWTNDDNIHITDHTSLTNIGTNTHLQIDTHLGATNNPHSTSLDLLTNTTIGSPPAVGEFLAYGLGSPATAVWTNATIDDYTEEVAPTSDDYVILYERTGGTHKKVQLVNLPTGATAFADESGSIILDVRNVSGGIINAGDPVYISGWNVGASIVEVGNADASIVGQMPAAGLVKTASIANNGTGQIVILGDLSGWDTSTWATGAHLYVAAGGGLTDTRPTGGATVVQEVGQVLRSFATGNVEVHGGIQHDIPNLATDAIWLGDVNGQPVQTTHNLNNVTDVGITSVATGEVLKWSGTAWINNTLAEAGIAAENESTRVNTQIGTTYVPVIGDAGWMITMDNAATNIVTLPPNSAVSYPINTEIHFAQLGVGQTTIAITTDTLNVESTLTLSLTGQYAVATAKKITATTWILFGNLEVA